MQGIRRLSEMGPEGYQGFGKLHEALRQQFGGEATQEAEEQPQEEQVVEEKKE